MIEAWKYALRANTSVDALVDETHPARADKYAASPLVREARAGRSFHYGAPADQRQVVNGRVFLNNRGSLSSIPERTYQTAPSSYSLYAPAEFFAECYVEYYREYDGQDAKQKGGRLAPWIKQWFDANVDRIRLNPGRARAK